MTEPSHPTTVSLADEEGVRRILVDTVFGLWTLVNNLTRLRPSKRERFRVTIFGSARTQPGHWVYEEVKRLAAELASMDGDIVTGGGPGLMQAANEGAAARRDHATISNPPWHPLPDGCQRHGGWRQRLHLRPACHPRRTSNHQPPTTNHS
ncbi:hypothetical protein [Thiocystis violacea]|uniref:hypothetical protein n=1 Tax=Thiocystis violacea TaxID=13725 RepID=UPI0019085557|nr:hypothetical protein [Thiocystis violacea]MBK1720382.1 hypothetical protein [Thiocystis violacea]